MSSIKSAAGGTAAELAKQIDRAETSPEETAAELDEPRMKKRWSFEFDYTDKRGRRWRGEFTNKILSIDDINRVGTIRAGACNYAPITSLDLATINNAETLAHLTVSLVKRPTWAADLGALHDPEVLAKLYQEVSSHEEIFHGHRSDPAAGPGGA